MSIKIAGFPFNNSGKGYYRITQPLAYINDAYKDVEAQVFNHSFQQINWKVFLKVFNILYFRGINANRPQEFPQIMSDLKKNTDLTLIYDIDDLDWDVSEENPLYESFKEKKLGEPIKKCMELADVVTVTTSNLKSQVLKDVKANVKIIPNALDFNHYYWNMPKIEDDWVRIGIITGSCYDEETEILTEDGFKFFKDLDRTEKVACLNPDTNELEYDTPTDYTAEKYDGMLYYGKNPGVDFAVTPNHKMFAARAGDRKKYFSRAKNSFKLEYAENLFEENVYVQQSANWKGSKKTTLTIPKLKYEKSAKMTQVLEIFEKHGGRKLIPKESIDGKKITKICGETLAHDNKRKLKLSVSKQNKYYLANIQPPAKYTKDLVLNMEDWIPFFGFWLAEGWTSSTKGLWQVGVCQAKDNNYLKIQYKLLKKMGFAPTYTKDGKQVRIFDRRVWEYLHKLGNQQKRYIPKDILNLPKKYLSVLVDWFVYGDGGYQTRGKGRTAWTTSKKLADNIQEICLKLGVGSSISKGRLKESIIRGRHVIAKHPCYEIGIGSSGKFGRHKKLVKKEDWSKKYYNGNVYCVTVPNHIIFVRRNGRTMWCGNSHIRDLLLLKGIGSWVIKNFKNTKFVLGGFDSRILDAKAPAGTIIYNESDANIWKQYIKVLFDDDVDWDRIEILRTRDIRMYAELYKNMDISLAPLKSNRFNKAKSNLKILEAAAYNIPIIAQDISQYTNTIVSGIDSYIAKTQSDWKYYLKKLIESKELRKKMGDSLNKKIRKEYDISVVSAKRKQIFEQAIKDKKRKKEDVMQAKVRDVLDRSLLAAKSKLVKKL